jgi:amino-acid N-acetyltransferase
MATRAPGPPAQVHVRPARTTDVQVIRHLVDTYAPDRRLLGKATVQLYEDVQEFNVAEVDGAVVGCGALHVMWEDLGEIRTVAVLPTHVRRGVGRAVVSSLVERAAVLGVQRLFCLTFEVHFFERLGFLPISGTPVSAQVFTELLQSEDEGVAEFLDLERVKPNTLGNTRMLLRLPSGHVL